MSDDPIRRPQQQKCADCEQPGVTVDDEGTWFHEHCGFPARTSPTTSYGASDE